MNPTLEQMVQHIYNELPAIVDAVKQIPQVLTSIQALEQGQAAFRQELDDFKTEMRQELAVMKHDLAALRQEFDSFKQEMRQELAVMKHDLAALRQEFDSFKQDFDSLKQEFDSFKVEMRQELDMIKQNQSHLQQQIAELRASQFALINEQAAFRHELSEMRREFRLELDLFRQQTARNAECHAMMEVMREQVSLHHSTFHAIQETLGNQLQLKTV